MVENNTSSKNNPNPETHQNAVTGQQYLIILFSGVWWGAGLLLQ